jgi:hypothetical protein
MNIYRVERCAVTGDHLIAYVKANNEEDAKQKAMELPSKCYCDEILSCQIIDGDVIVWHEFNHEEEFYYGQL